MNCVTHGTQDNNRYNCIWNDFLKDTSLNVSPKMDIYTYTINHLLLYTILMFYISVSLIFIGTPWFEKSNTAYIYHFIIMVWSRELDVTFLRVCV